MHQIIVEIALRVFSSINGVCVNSNTNLLSLFISTRFGSQFFNQWKRKTFLLHSRILICKKTFPISPPSKIGLNHDRTKISHIEFWRGGTVSSQSFREAEFLVGFEEALYTILSLVVSTDSLMIHLCETNKTVSFPLLSPVHNLHLPSL